MSRIRPFEDINLSVGKNNNKNMFQKITDWIKSSPSNLKNKLIHAKQSYSNSWKLQLILKFFLLLFFINIMLMSIGEADEHYEVKKNPEDIITNSFYLTTTQLTTIGYGDITPVSTTAKLVVSCAHLVIMYIAYSLAEEFGALSKTAERQEIILGENIRPINKKLSISSEFKEEIMKDYLNSRTNDNTKNYTPKEKIADVLEDSVNMQKKSSVVVNAAEKLLRPVYKLREAEDIRRQSI